MLISAKSAFKQLGYATPESLSSSMVKMKKTNIILYNKLVNEVRYGTSKFRRKYVATEVKRFEKNSIELLDGINIIVKLAKENYMSPTTIAKKVSQDLLARTPKIKTHWSAIRFNFYDKKTIRYIDIESLKLQVLSAKKILEEGEKNAK